MKKGNYILFLTDNVVDIRAILVIESADIFSPMYDRKIRFLKLSLGKPAFVEITHEIVFSA